MNKNNNTNGMQKINYQKLLDKITDRIGMECAEGNNRPSLFLHACCAPCSSYVLEYLVKYFKITIFYYNPNIPPKQHKISHLKIIGRGAPSGKGRDHPSRRAPHHKLFLE